MTVENPAIPLAPEDLTPAWLTAALREGGTIDMTTSVVAAEVEPLGNGQVGQVLRVELDYSEPDSGPASIVAKIPAREESRRQFAMALGAYDTEVYFYRDVAPHVDMAVPGLLGSFLEPGSGRFALLLEDLSATTQVGDTVNGATIEQAAAALQALPGLQVPTWHLDRLTNDPWWGDHGRSHVIFSMVPQALPMLVEQFGGELERRYLDLVRWVGTVADRLATTVWTPPFVMAHGDYRLDNMLFGRAPGAPEVSLIDWQAARLAPPLVDVAMFLGPNLDPGLRQDCERELLDDYHQRLLAAGVDGFTFDDCWTRYRLSTLYPLSGAISGATLLARTERDAQVWLRILRHCADMAIDLETTKLFD